MKIKIDGIEVEIENPGAQVVENAIAKRDSEIVDIRSQIAQAKKQVETEKARADKAEEDLSAEKKAREDAERPEAVRERVDARLKIEREASKILGEDQKLDGMTDDEIRAAVVIKTAKDPEAIKAKLDGCDPAYLSARYDAAIDGFEPPADDGDGKPNPALARVRTDASKADGGSDSDKARQRMIEANRKAGRDPLRASAS